MAAASRCCDGCHPRGLFRAIVLTAAAPRRRRVGLSVIGKLAASTRTSGVVLAMSDLAASNDPPRRRRTSRLTSDLLSVTGQSLVQLRRLVLAEVAWRKRLSDAHE